MKQETTERIRGFTRERAWKRCRTPANLAKSISIKARYPVEKCRGSSAEYDRV